MKKTIFNGLIIVFLVTAFFGCRDNDFEKLRQRELERLEEFIDANYPNVEPEASGLYFIPIEEGTGDSLISVGDRVQIFYATWTWTTDSLLVDESNGYTNGYRYNPYEFVVGEGNAISGLEEAMTYMKKGGKANLVIPSELAYGQTGSAGISGFTTLLMQVEVHKVFPPEGQ